MVYVDVTDLTEMKHWSKTKYDEKYMSHHCHRGSAIETDTDCGNCDGARCDGCTEVAVPPHYECSISCDELEEMLAKKNVPEGIIFDMVYDDYYRASKTGYKLLWPSERMLKEQNPKLYEELLQRDAQE